MWSFPGPLPEWFRYGNNCKVRPRIFYYTQTMKEKIILLYFVYLENFYKDSSERIKYYQPEHMYNDMLC